LFLDNDKAGETCKNSILKSFPEAKNHSEIYALHKDLNDYLQFKNNTEIEKKQQIDLKSKQEQEESEIIKSNLQKKTLIMWLPIFINYRRKLGAHSQL
jgi:hypothetical protein